jgi:hypothetical protein
MERIPLEQSSKNGKFGGWQTVLIVIATWVISSAVNWGVIQERQQDMIRRLDAMDRAISQQVPRIEYDDWRAELNRRLDRIEQKLDTLLANY